MMASFLGMLQVFILLVFGAYRASAGLLSVGTLVAFTAYTHRVMHPVRQLGKILTEMGKALVSLERIQEILDEPVETDADQQEQPVIRGALEFRQVTFGYHAAQPVVKNVSFSVQPGQTIGILGPTGAGKTSLVHLLARLYDYQSGTITIDGVELRRIEKKWLRRHVGLVLQEPYIFSKTVKDNITLANGQSPDTDMVAAAQMAALHDVVMQFEQRYETLIGEKGMTLSGGQRQRVAIAQTLLKHAPILILDDSLSSVDTETDALIRQALRQQHRATTFVISHRLTTLAETDLILVVEHGEIVQRGTHDDLIRQEGLYRRLWLIQNELEEEIGHELAQNGVEEKLH